MLTISIILGVLALIAIGIGLYLTTDPQFGGKVRKQDLERFRNSPQWDGKKFVNQSPTVMDVNLRTMPKIIREQFRGRKAREPQGHIEIVPIDRKAFAQKDGKPKFIWFSHSVLLLQLDGTNILIDPMFGPNAAPVAPFAVRRYIPEPLSLIDQLPDIDAVLLTHDHYDHLDYASIKRLMPKVDTWYTALGVGRHLEKWGVPSGQISEMDWWDQTELDGIQLTFTPARHFSGRGLTDRAKSLWGGWALKGKEHNIYWSGDSGYDEHFKEVGNRLGPFDWGFMECGQYNEHWHAIHMYPEESVQAALDARVKVATPVHWAGFTLALHHWQDPVERFVAEARNLGQDILVPRIGEVRVLGGEKKQEEWWRG